MFFLLPVIGAVASALGAAGAATAAAAATTAAGLGSALGGLGTATGLGAAAGLGSKVALGALAKGTVAAAARRTALNAAARAVAGAACCGVAGSVGESFVKNVFGDPVAPRRGSVLKVDLAGGVVSHTGIYLGNGRIAEVSEIDGDAIVREVTPSGFLNGEGLVRTGMCVYVAAAKGEGPYRALARESVARRAESALGHRGKYSLAFNNCHMFTRYCITGEDRESPTWSLSGIESALRGKYGVSLVSWRSTGDFA